MYRIEIYVCTCLHIFYLILSYFIKIDFYNTRCEVFNMQVFFHYLGGEADSFELQTQKQNFYRGKLLHI